MAKGTNPFRRGKIWWIRFSFKGKQLRESSKSPVWSDADRLLKRRMGEIVIGKFAGTAPERITIGDLLDAVEADYLDKRRHSLPQLRTRIEKWLRPALGDVRAADFGTDHLRRLRPNATPMDARPQRLIGG